MTYGVSITSRGTCHPQMLWFGDVTCQLPSLILRIPSPVFPQILAATNGPSITFSSLVYSLDLFLVSQTPANVS